MRPYKIITTGLPPKEVYYLRGPAFEDEDSEPVFLDRECAEEECRLCNDVHEAAQAPSRGGADSSFSSLSSRPPAGA